MFSSVEFSAVISVKTFFSLFCNWKGCFAVSIDKPPNLLIFCFHVSTCINQKLKNLWLSGFRCIVKRCITVSLNQISNYSSLASKFAPALINKETVFDLLYFAAICKGVSPNLFIRRLDLLIFWFNISACINQNGNRFVLVISCSHMKSSIPITLY